MPKYYLMPAKCCCCSLRTGSIVVGSLSVVVALILLGLAAAFSYATSVPSCSTTCTGSGCTRSCTPVTDTEKFLSNLLALLAIINAAEVVISMGLIWGASKRILSWVTGWLLVTASWILLHSSIALSLLFATSDPGIIILVSVLGTFVFGLAILAFLTVLSLRKEMTDAARLSTENDNSM